MNTMYKIGEFADASIKPVEIKLPPEVDSLILLTEPNREMTTQANLIMRHIPFYLPTMLRPARISMKRHLAGKDHPDVVRPLFPGVIFLGLTVAAANDDLIRRTPGVMSPARPYMKFGDNLAVLSAEAMQVIRYIEAGEREMYYRARARPVPGYLPKAGDSIRVLVNQVLGGYGGTVANVDDAGRITVLMDVMKRTVRVKLTKDQIEPV